MNEICKFRMHASRSSKMTNRNRVTETIKEKLQIAGGKAAIPLQRGGIFTATLVEGGVQVDNLDNQPFLPWAVFEEAVDFLARHGSRAPRGNAMEYKLGESGLPLDSIEGHIAHAVYNKGLGDSVFRRITPIAGILVWAGICDSAPGELILRKITGQESGR